MVKERIAILCDSPLMRTSYSNVGLMLVNILKDNYDIDWYAFQYIGMPLNMKDYNLISIAKPDDVKNHIKNQKYKHVIYIRNTWIFSSYGQIEPVRLFRNTSNDIIVYSPVEEQLLPKSFFMGYGEFYDRLITMTNTGADTIAKYGYRADVLYHYFMPEKRAYNESQDWFLNISYSQDYRKNLGMYFYLASNFRDYKFAYFGKSAYYVLSDYVELYRIKNLLLPADIMKSNTSFNFISDKALSQLYGASRYYIQCSYKEGFDLTSMEALVNGLVVFMPSDDLHKELFSDFPNAIFVKGGYVVPLMNQIEYFVMPQEWIETIAANTDKSKRGYRLPDKFKKETVAKQLENILNKA